VTVGAGDVVGELATLDPHRTRNATVVAAGPIEVLVYDVATYRSLAQVDDLRSRLAPARVAA
jgi:CRP-like cAMP-binding protein